MMVCSPPCALQGDKALPMSPCSWHPCKLCFPHALYPVFICSPLRALKRLDAFSTCLYRSLITQLCLPPTSGSPLCGKRETGFSLGAPDPLAYTSLMSPSFSDARSFRIWVIRIQFVFGLGRALAHIVQCVAICLLACVSACDDT